jgi:hypothetical protein
MRLDSYVRYLAALYEGSEGVRATLLGDHAPEVDKPLAAELAFRSAAVYSAREQVMLVAPDSVVAAGRRASHQLRGVRDLVAQGHSLDSTQYQQAMKDYSEALGDLRNVMRKDLGARSIDFRTPRTLSPGQDVSPGRN